METDFHLKQYPLGKEEKSIQRNKKNKKIRVWSNRE